MPALIQTQIPKAGYVRVKEQIGIILALELENQKTLNTFPNMPDIYTDRTVPADSADDIYLNILVASGNFGEITQRDAQGRIIYFVDFHTAAEESATESGSSVSSARLHQFMSMVMYIFRTPYYRTMGLPLGLIGGTYVEAFTVLDPHQKEDLDFTRFGRVQIAVRVQEDTEAWQGVPLLGQDTVVRLDQTEKGYKFVYDKTP